MRVPPLSTAIFVAVSAVSSDAADVEAMHDGATQMVLGSKLENPYTVSNWQLAGENVPPAQGSGGGSLFTEHSAPTPAMVAATHKYVKFTPHTEVSVWAAHVKRERSIVLYLHLLVLIVSPSNSPFEGRPCSTERFGR